MQVSWEFGGKITLGVKSSDSVNEASGRSESGVHMGSLAHWWALLSHLLSHIHGYGGAPLTTSPFTPVWAAFKPARRLDQHMEKQTAEALAKKGYAIIKSAAKSGVAAISQGVHSVRKGYATKHEADVLAELKSQGLHPAEHLHAGFFASLHLP